MNAWMIVVGIVLLLFAVSVWSTKAQTIEGFSTAKDVIAQHQQLNQAQPSHMSDLAQLMNPSSEVNPSKIEATVSQVAPVSSNDTSSRMGMIGLQPQVAALTRNPGRGLPVENTEMLQSKIEFCESLKGQPDCKQINNPAFAECGFCLKDGKDSKGNAHMGGLYVSSEDQVRANEDAAQTGKSPVYKPSAGSCPANQFVTLPGSCEEQWLTNVCAGIGYPSGDNWCGQCFGGSPAGSSGMMYMTTKKPYQFMAYFHVSHPGGHGGIKITNSRNDKVDIPPSFETLDDHTVIPFYGSEGEVMNFVISGMPAVWCGWVSNSEVYDRDGTSAQFDTQRYVSLDVGMAPNLSPAGAIEIAGDSNAPAVKAAFKGNVPPTPKTVFWYKRDNKTLNGMITSAWYGTTPPTAKDPIGFDVTAGVKAAAGLESNYKVTDSTFGYDPKPGVPKTLYIYFDNGKTIMMPQENYILGAAVKRNVFFTFVMPATLADPPFSTDKTVTCPTGPIVLTELGAGLMGSHSCFGSDGSFNPTLYCIQELFTSAGGSYQGSLYPKDDTAAEALVMRGADGKPSLNGTSDYLNNLGNIATYGITTDGATASYDEYMKAAKEMLGLDISNPCPPGSLGPHTPQCMDYLYKTSGNAGIDNRKLTSSELSGLQYEHCKPGGSFAPLNADGSINQDNFEQMRYGPINVIRGIYETLYNQTKDNSNFDVQRDAVRKCFGANMTQASETAASCPPKNPDEWQCVTPQMLQKPEVFQVNTPTTYANAESVCSSYGAYVASSVDLNNSQSAKGEWCSPGWVADTSANAYFPTQQGCSIGRPGIQTKAAMDLEKRNGVPVAGVHCYGKRPMIGTPDIAPFNLAATWWWQPQAISESVLISDNAIPALIEINEGVACASDNGWDGCAMFSSLNECQKWATNPPNTQGYYTINRGYDYNASKIDNVAAPYPEIAKNYDQYLRARV